MGPRKRSDGGVARDRQPSTAQQALLRRYLRWPRDQRGAANHLQVTELTAAVAARLARAEEEDTYEDALDIASNAVMDLVRAAKLDEAEAAARDLLGRFPDVHDGWDRLGMVHEARGENKQAADCYRKAIEIIRAEPEMYDPQFADVFVKLVDKLDLPGAAQTTE